MRLFPISNHSFYHAGRNVYCPWCPHLRNSTLSYQKCTVRPLKIHGTISIPSRSSIRSAVPNEDAAAVLSIWYIRSAHTATNSEDAGESHWVCRLILSICSTMRGYKYYVHLSHQVNHAAFFFTFSFSKSPFILRYRPIYQDSKHCISAFYVNLLT